jgi:hypothetical protein
MPVAPHTIMPQSFTVARLNSYPLIWPGVSEKFASLVGLFERTGVVDTDDFLESREWMQDTGIPVALSFRRRGCGISRLAG